jgi:hypothetical protein
MAYEHMSMYLETTGRYLAQLQRQIFIHSKNIYWVPNTRNVVGGKKKNLGLLGVCNSGKRRQTTFIRHKIYSC